MSVPEIRTLATLEGFSGISTWVEITQDRINRFADPTGDHQWIHVDPEKAAAGPFGTTIAHGYLTLSLGPAFMFELLEVEDASLVVNYGLNKVRFPSPVPVGSRVRMRAEVASLEEADWGVQATLDLTFETEGKDKPACAAEAIYRFYK
jgi:acyl dehydratase